MPAPFPISTAPSARDELWQHCRNILGIARLLVQEGRPQPLVATACHVAVETACRAALAQAALPYEGRVEEALRELGVPRELCVDTAVSATERLARTEHTVGWVADYLKRKVPGRSWGL